MANTRGSAERTVLEVVGAKAKRMSLFKTYGDKNRTFANESPMLNCFNEVGRVKSPMVGYNFRSIV